MNQSPQRIGKILITTGGTAGVKLARKLGRLGIDFELIPCIRIDPAPNPTDINEAVRKLHNFDWLVVTSRNGVDALSRAVKAEQILPHERDIKVAAVGPSTAAQIASIGFQVDLVPAQATAADLLRSLLQQDLAGRKVLLLQGTLSGPELAAALVSVGARIRVVLAYTTVEEVSDVERLRQLVEAGELAAVALMSGSAARALRNALDKNVFDNLRLVCIGPTTAAAVEELGARPARVATPHTTLGRARAVAAELGISENEREERNR